MRVVETQIQEEEEELIHCFIRSSRQSCKKNLPQTTPSDSRSSRIRRYMYCNTRSSLYLFLFTKYHARSSLVNYYPSFLSDDYYFDFFTYGSKQYVHDQSNEQL